MISVEQGLQAYEVSKLTPVSGVTFRFENGEVTGGCMLGALAWAHGANECTPPGVISAMLEQATGYSQIEIADCALGFDMGFSGDEVSSVYRQRNKNMLPFDNGYEIGVAVREKFSPEIIDEQMSEKELIFRRSNIWLQQAIS